MINACLFGAGRIGRDHARRILNSPHANLYSVVDPDTEAAKQVADEFEAIQYTNAEDALADSNVDAIVIASSSATHVDLIIASAQANKPIFCEKPIDLDLDRIDQCLKVVEDKGVSLLVGFNRRFDPSFQTLQHRLVDGDIGKIELLIISSRDAPLPEISYLRMSGGMFYDMTVHDFDIARWLLQEEPVEVFATGSVLVDKRIGEFDDVDTAMLVLRTESGALCHINNSRRSAYGYDQRIEVFGERGMLRANNVIPTTVEYSFDEGVKTDNTHFSYPQRYVEAYQNEIDHFFTDVVFGKKAPLISGEDGRQAIVIAEAANQSLKSGQPQKIPYTKAVLSL